VKSNGAKRATITTIFFTCIIIAIARPYSGFTEIKKGNHGVDNLVIFDVSDSMRADDLKPSRLEIGKRKILDLAAILREKNLGDRIGIILFAGQAYLYCPPTVDFEALKQFVSHLSSDLISAQGSGINIALDTASEIIQRLKMKSPRLFIFTDGEDVGFSEERASTTLKALDLKPLILGIGTETGSPIDIPGEGFIRDNSGNLVITKLNEKNLTGLATATGGKSVHSEVGLSDLQSLLENTSTLLNNPEGDTGTIRIYNEFGHLFIWGALTLLLLSTIFKRSIPIIILVLAGLTPVKASAAPNVYESWKLYENGAYQEAKSGFEAALKESPNSPEILQALGSTQFKLGNFKEAAEIFSQLTTNAKNKSDLFAGQYNLGNTFLQSKKYDEAIHEFEEALKIKPTDEATQFNLELAKKLKEEPPPSPQNNQQDQENQDKQEGANKDQEKNQQSSKNKSEKDNTTPSPENSGNQDQQEPNKENPKEGQDISKDDKSKENTQESENAGSENIKSEQEQPQQNTPSEPKAKTERELAKEEADKWLNSLPTAPIQIRRNQQRLRVQNGQTW
jgi:Ca-activated chloride channel family protein